MAFYKWKNENITLFKEALELSKNLPKNQILVRWRSNAIPTFPEELTKQPLPKNIEVRDQHYITTLIELASQGVKPTIVCVANDSIPGGNVQKGLSDTQEEILCRVSNLYPSLMRTKNKNLYPMNNPFLIRDIVFFRNSQYQSMTPIYGDILMSAPRYPKKYRSKLTAGGRIDMRKRIKKLIEIAVTNKSKYLILTAYGCDNNNPAHEIANIFRQLLVLDKLCLMFEQIIFSIPVYHKIENSSSHIMESPYPIFKTILE